VVCLLYICRYSSRWFRFSNVLIVRVISPPRSDGCHKGFVIALSKICMSSMPCLYKLIPCPASRWRRRRTRYSKLYLSARHKVWKLALTQQCCVSICRPNFSGPLFLCRQMEALRMYLETFDSYFCQPKASATCLPFSLSLYMSSPPHDRQHSPSIPAECRDLAVLSHGSRRPGTPNRGAYSRAGSKATTVQGWLLGCSQVREI